MNKATCSTKNGSTLLMTVALLTISSLLIGALAVFSTTNSRNLRSTISREQSFYLADAGLRCAMNQMVNEESGVIAFADSRAFFSDTSVFGTDDWGFETSIINISGRTNELTSSGSYGGIEQVATVECIDVSTDTYLNFIYRLVVYSGEIGGLFQVGGTGDDADFVNGDVYARGSISVQGDARLRHGEMDATDDGIQEVGEEWTDAYATEYLGPMTQEAFDTYVASKSSYVDLYYNNETYDAGEAFVDTIGNGIYDENESYTDLNGDGEYTYGDTEQNDTGNGVWDEGETWVDDADRYGRDNNQYDYAGGYYNSKGKWKTSYKERGKTYYCWYWPAEAFEDESDTTYTEAEPFVDTNGVYDEGEEFFDDRNGSYDWGTMASGLIVGMDYVDASTGLRNAVGGYMVIEPPDLPSMYYSEPKTGPTPSGASEGWGHDVAVTESDYSSNGKLITSTSKPEHIFTRNIRQSPTNGGNGYYRDTISGVTVRSREYTLVYDNDGERVDDYFLEDPTEPTYTAYDTSNEIDGTVYTAPSYINVEAEDNGKVYYVDGNLYLHASPTFCLRFKEPGTQITIVAKGNIIISDEFYYNADYDPDLGRDDVDSTIVHNPTDMLCLIALANPNCEDSGNIYIGDDAYGTGGSIHAMMYAEKDFIDNNLRGSDQAFISIYGNMAAGGNLDISRSTWDWTRLDVSLDKRLSLGTVTLEGLPPAPAGSYFIGNDGVPDWQILEGTWKSSSVLSQE